MRFILLLTITIYLSGVLFPQTITFDREFNFKIHNSVQIPDGDYIISGYDFGKLVVSRLDEYGYIKWTKSFNDTKDQDPAASLILVPGGFFISTNFYESIQISIDSVINKTYARLLKFDLDGNIMLDKKYDRSPYDEHGYQVIEADSGKYFFLTDHYLYKIDSSGDIIIDSTLGFYVLNRRYPITRISENQYILTSFTQAICINKDYDTLWTYPLVSSLFNTTVFCKSADGNVIMFNQKKLYKLNGLTGEILFEKTITDLNRMIPRNVIKKNDKIYLLWTTNASSFNSIISIFESDTIKTSEFSISRLLDQISTDNDGFIFFGSKYKSYRLLKTDEYFYYKTVILKEPALSYYNYNYWYSNSFSNQFFGLQKYTLTWESNNVDYINLDYSTDAGSTWINIATNLSCDSSTYPPVPIFQDSISYPRYEWVAPAIFSDRFLLRAIAGDDQSLFDQTDPVGSIFVYQDVDTISSNQIKMWIANYGMGSHHPGTDGAGFFWPGGEDATITSVFADGLVWGGKVNGEIRVNGCTYRYGLQPGGILENGKAENPFSVKSKIFKLKNNWESLPSDNTKNRLEFDYDNWPAEIGAPWDDVNNDGVYTKGIDTPKLIGDETLFYVANDLDTMRSLYTYGSNPMGLEIQTTVFGFNREDLKDVVFKKYKVINKSKTDIKDMYFTYWADPDLGYCCDDLSGFDSTYNMAYVYNADNNDEYYYGTPPPTLAHMLVQGPIISTNNSDSARFDDGWRIGYKNLGMTASGLIVKSSSIYPRDVMFGDYESFYNVMQGLKNDGSYVIDPTTNLPTIFQLAGDPVTQTGWYNLYNFPSYGGDQRYHAPTGPFNLAVGDTQEVVYAIMMAKGTDNLNSITKLRELAAHVQDFYNTELVDILNTKQTIAPTGYSLSQNYPNPFNPRTIIEYEVPEKSFVTIKIYDILGREVQTLVNNEEKVRYKYKVVFDASILSSGVYFYRMQAGNYTETKKMVLIK